MWPLDGLTVRAVQLDRLRRKGWLIIRLDLSSFEQEEIYSRNLDANAFNPFSQAVVFSERSVFAENSFREDSILILKFGFQISAQTEIETAKSRHPTRASNSGIAELQFQSLKFKTQSCSPTLRKL